MIARERAQAYEQFLGVTYPLNTRRWFVENNPGHDIVRKIGPFEEDVLLTYIQKSTGEDYKPLVIGEISSHKMEPGQAEVWLAILMDIPLITVYLQELVLRPPKLAGLDITYIYDGLYRKLCSLAEKQVVDDKKNGQVRYLAKLSSYTLHNLQRHRITIPMGARKTGGRFLYLRSRSHQGGWPNYRVFDLRGNICDCYESRVESLMKGTFIMAEVEPVVFKLQGDKRVS